MALGREETINTGLRIVDAKLTSTNDEKVFWQTEDSLKVENCRIIVKVTFKLSVSFLGGESQILKAF